MAVQVPVLKLCTRRWARASDFSTETAKSWNRSMASMRTSSRWARKTFQFLRAGSFRSEVVHAQVGEGIRLFHRDREILEQIDGVDAHIVAVGQEDFPVLAGRIVFRSRHNGEIDSALIGADIERTLAVVQVIPMLLLARQEDREIVLWIGGRQVADFAGVLGLNLEHEVLAVARLADLDIVEFVL